MTDRKKRGVGYIISGVVFVGVGGVLFGTEATPEWVATVVQGIGLIANLLGFTTVFPDTE
jgi:ABC-type uncharacterized transport system permease subunit